MRLPHQIKENVVTHAGQPPRADVMEELLKSHDWNQDPQGIWNITFGGVNYRLNFVVTWQKYAFASTRNSEVDMGLCTSKKVGEIHE